MNYGLFEKGIAPKLWQWEIRWLATGFEVCLRYTYDQTNPHAVFQYQQRECGLPTKTDDLPEWTWCFSTIFSFFFCDQPTWVSSLEERISHATNIAFQRQQQCLPATNIDIPATTLVIGATSGVLIT
jgi:hypothetical protein